MLFYNVLFLFFLVFSFVTVITRKSNHRFEVLSILVLAFFVAFRDRVGADWSNYVEYYQSGYAPDKLSGNYEPVFMVLRDICYYLHFDYELFFYVISIFTLLCIRYSGRVLNVDNFTLVLFVYICMFFCNFQFNIVRSGAMASCMWVAFSQAAIGRQRCAFIWTLIAAGFHIIAILFIPIVYLIERPYKQKFVFILIALSYTILIFKLGHQLISHVPMLATFDRLDGYIDKDVDGNGITLGSALNLAIFFYMYMKYKKEYYVNRKFRVIVNVLFWGVVICSSLNAFSTIATRAGHVLNMSLIFVWPIILGRLNKKSIRGALYLVLCVYWFMYFNKSVNVEDIFGQSSLVPYQIEIKSIVR